MTIYGSRRKKVRGPSDTIFLLVLLSLMLLASVAAYHVGKIFYPLLFER